MKKVIKILSISSIILLTISSCSTKKDEAFCLCLESGKKLNEQSKIILSGKYNDKDIQKHLNLLKEKKKACEPFKTLNGDALKSKKSSCGFED